MLIRPKNDYNINIKFYTTILWGEQNAWFKVALISIVITGFHCSAGSDSSPIIHKKKKKILVYKTVNGIKKMSLLIVLYNNTVCQRHNVIQLGNKNGVLWSRSLLFCITFLEQRKNGGKGVKTFQEIGKGENWGLDGLMASGPSEEKLYHN
jgi:hypothetical protein